MLFPCGEGLDQRQFRGRLSAEARGQSVASAKMISNKDQQNPGNWTEQGRSTRANSRRELIEKAGYNRGLEDAGLLRGLDRRSGTERKRNREREHTTLRRAAFQ